MRGRVFEPGPGAQARIPLRAVAASPEDGAGVLEEAVLLAAPDLIGAPGEGRAGEPGRRNAAGAGSAGAGSAGAERSLRAYDIRSRTRPTPSGVFSGVAPVRFTSSARPGRGNAAGERLTLGTAHRAVTTPSGPWLAAVADRMLDDPDVLDRVTLTTDNTVRTVDGRFEVAYASPEGAIGVHSVRDTPVSRMLLHICANGRPAAELLAVLRGLLADGAGATSVAPAVPPTPGPSASAPVDVATFERAARADAAAFERTARADVAAFEQAALDNALADFAALRTDDGIARDTLLRMIRSGLLLTDLTPGGPPSLTLTALAAFTRPGDAWSVLPQLRDLLARADAHPPGEPTRLELLRLARQLMADPAPPDRPLVADTRADAEVVLPRRLAEQAATAAGVLWRTAHTKPPLTRYHRRFVETYGIHRMVPLTEVLDTATGLGPPDPDDGLGASAEPAPARLSLLAELAGRHGPDNEVVLTEDLVDRLAAPHPEPPPRSAEIHVRVVRDGGGPLRVAVCPGTGSQQAGSATARFAALGPTDTFLDPAGREAVDGDPGVLVAHVACRPPTPAAAALAPPAAGPGQRIAVGVPPRPGDLVPADLHVASDGRRLVLWSPRHGRRVVPVVPHRLNPALLPDSVRLLRLLGQTGTRPWHTWSWGPYAELPSTPRVRHGNVVLAPARWTLPGALTRAADRPAEFAARLHDWRTGTRPPPPPNVTVEEADRLLPLDLDDPRDREILRSRVRHGVRAVLEPLGAATCPAVVRGRDGGHLLEVVVPLRRADDADDTVRLDPRCAPRSRADEPLDRSADWLSLAVRVPEHRQDAALRRLGRVMAARAPQDACRCFWLRYATRDFGPQLRVRFAGCPDHRVETLRPVAEHWVRGLRANGLAGAARWEAYVPETERYGGPDCLSAAEAVFAADSALALAALGPHTPGPAGSEGLPEEDRRILLGAGSAVRVARLLADGSPRAVGTAGLTRDARRRREALRGAFRTTVAQSPPGDTALGAAWYARDTALSAYREALTAVRRAEIPAAVPHSPASPGIVELCASDLIHLHVNRLLGPDPATERLVRSLAADVLHRP
ncbi:lantibiotic dehydratase [Streptomyces sp. NPDC001568]|uniref:lantibiotic dehydratase n=1 Tax=Streptomyces sp. NPDC001568 TaxID=3364588 RepID=UPI00369C276E